MYTMTEIFYESCLGVKESPIKSNYWPHDFDNGPISARMCEF